MADPKDAARQLAHDPGFYDLPWEDRRKKMAAVYPVFAGFDAKNQDDFLKRLQEKYGNQGGVMAQAGRDLKLGFRSGASELAQTGANALGLFPAFKDTAKSLHEYSQKEAPRPEELQGRNGLMSEVLRGVGSAPAQIAEYAPAMLSKKYAPVVAGGIGALSALDQGPYAAIEQGIKQAAGFKLMEGAQKLPTRTARAAGSAAAMALPTAIETKGDLTKTAASAITGGALGAVGGKKEYKPRPQNEVLESVTRDFRAKFNPRKLGPEAETTAQIMTHKLAEFAQRVDRADYALREIRKDMDKLPENKDNPGGVSDDALKFMFKMQTGAINELEPKYQPFAKEIRQKFDDTLERIQKHGMLQSFMENYFPQMWTDSKKGEQIYRVMAKRPLEGGKGFLRQRVFQTVMDGIAYAKAHPELGMKLASNNPIDLVMMQLREQEKFIMARDVMKEMKEQGLLKFVRLGDHQPAGWRQIDDKFSTVKVPRPGGYTVVGHYFAPDAAAQVMNNHLSPGLRSHAGFRAYLNAANNLNKFQLGYSAFHLGFTTFDAAVSQHALALGQLIEGARRRDAGMFGRGIKSYAKTPFVPFEPILKAAGKSTVANKIMAEWDKPGTHPEVTHLVEMMKAGGARVHEDPFYRLNGWETFKKANQASNMVSRTALRAMGIMEGFTDKSTKWLFNYVVPMQKIGAFYRLAEFEMSKLGPDATNSEVRSAMQKAWASVDNRMGQLVYDNLFWNKTAKDMMMASVRSVGWNIGTWREIGGGIGDIGRAFKDAAHGKRWEFTTRMGYVVSLPVVIGTLGGVIHYLGTGKRPESMVDYFFPATGDVDEYGRPVRVSLPSYIRDLAEVSPHKGEGTEEYLRRIGKKAQGKIHPALTIIAEMLENRDWQNGEIRNEDDPAVKQLLDTAKFVGEQVLPFSFRYSVEDKIRSMSGVPRQYNTKQGVEAFFGLTPAPADITKTPAEQVEDKYIRRNLGTRPRSAQEVAKAKLRQDLRRLAAMHDDKDFNRLAEQAQKAGTFSDSDIEKIKEEAGITPLVSKFKRLRLDQAITVYQYVIEDKGISDAEKESVRSALADKLGRNWYKVEALPETSPMKVKLRNQLRLLNMLDSEDNPIEE